MLGEELSAADFALGVLAALLEEVVERDELLAALGLVDVEVLPDRSSPRRSSPPRNRLLRPSRLRSLPRSPPENRAR